jgi:hypothetical protein
MRIVTSFEGVNAFGKPRHVEIELDPKTRAITWKIYDRKICCLSSTNLRTGGIYSTQAAARRSARRQLARLAE